MDSEGADMEERDEYMRVVSKTYRSEDKGFQFYNEYAMVKGFSVRKEEVKYLPGSNVRFWRLYTCFKEGYRSLSNFERADPKRTPKALTRCGCPAHLEIELNAVTGEWFVKKFQDVMDVMEHQAGGPDKIGFIPRDLYNFVAEYKKKI